ncbi:hypothetical protein BSKO_06560 [Bryopsis sp. KO-2023]|nr:hypothetical protein BSKO_06560 [Bryopsis sp. KO-2023]
MSTKISEEVSQHGVPELEGFSLKTPREGDEIDLMAQLIEAKRFVKATFAKLEEKDAAMSDLTEHFLQVYQIASDLATENDNSALELRQLQLLSDNLKEQVIQRDALIAELEGKSVEHDNQLDGLSDVSTEFANNRCPSAQGDDLCRTGSFSQRSRSTVSDRSGRRSPFHSKAPTRSSFERPSPESMMNSLSLRLDPNRGSRIPRPPLSRRTRSMDGHHYLDVHASNKNRKK